MRTTYFIGIDPGATGAVAVIDHNSNPIDCLKLKDATPLEVADFLAKYRDTDARVVVEQVVALPDKSSPWAMAKLMRSQGILVGIVTAHRFRIREVRATVWQTKLNCKTGGKKAISRAAAQQRWPNVRLTDANADAHLLAEFGRLTWE